MAHHRGDSWGRTVRGIYRGWGADGEILANVVIAVGDLQHDALIDQRLAAYLAGRDAVIDLGDSLGIHSQPDRPKIGEVAELDPAGRAGLLTVVTQLERLARDTSALQSEIDDLGREDPVFDEVRDGLAIDALRARFVARIYSSALANASGGDAERDLIQAQGLLDQARKVVARRREASWRGPDDRIFAIDDANQTVYRFGYLGKADTLCYWERERAELTNLVRGTKESVPPCT
jgi:hypothetical protein